MTEQVSSDAQKPKLRGLLLADGCELCAEKLSAQQLPPLRYQN